MQHFKVLKTTLLILVFALVTFSCATSKSQISDAKFGLTVETVSEGLLLTFNNIPPDSIRLFISVHSWCHIEEVENGQNTVVAFADIRDTSFSEGGLPSLQLTRVKETGKVIFPIVQAGQKYHISAMIQTRADIDNKTIPVFVDTEIIGKNGIYFNRKDVGLELINNSAVTLYTEPLFTSPVIFHTQKYSFGITIMVDENRSIGLGTHHIPAGLSSDGLTWIFEPEMTESLRKYNAGWLETGNYYPAWAKAYVNILHSDIIWSVEIARTQNFNFSL